jgi:hypothetical protein
MTKRPNDCVDAGVGGVLRPSRRKWRCSVVTDGPPPCWVRMIRATWAAVRAGRSLFSATAASNSAAAVRGVTCRGLGTSASNPSVRSVCAHRSSEVRDTHTSSPAGPTCRCCARDRTSSPRSRAVSCGSSNGRTSEYRNNATARALASFGLRLVTSNFLSSGPETGPGEDRS